MARATWATWVQSTWRSQFFLVAVPTSPSQEPEPELRLEPGSEVFPSNIRRIRNGFVLLAKVTLHKRTNLVTRTARWRMFRNGPTLQVSESGNFYFPSSDLHAPMADEGHCGRLRPFFIPGRKFEVSSRVSQRTKEKASLLHVIIYDLPAARSSTSLAAGECSSPPFILQEMNNSQEVSLRRFSSVSWLSLHMLYTFGVFSC